jgi:hypothetical protein
MDPVAPFAKMFEWGGPALALWGVLLGLGFGFFLERGGMGDSRRLAGQWYGYDFAVVRVMFTAIVTAMLVVFGLHYAGVLDLGRVSLNETFLAPQAVGGLVFGAGFVLAEYCPGTALVGAASGRLDALAYVGGFFAGALAFVYGFPLVESFYGSTASGRLLLPELLHLPAGVTVLGVAVLALGAFALTHVLDRRRAARA